NRPGWAGAWQRRRETNVLASAELLIPWSDSSSGAGRFVGTLPRSVVLPPRVEGLPYRGSRNLDAVAYAANPEKRGLDLLCRAWLDLAPRSSRLLIGGLDSRTAKKYLAGSD